MDLQIVKRNVKVSYAFLVFVYERLTQSRNLQKAFGVLLGNEINPIQWGYNCNLNILL